MSGPNEKEKARAELTKLLLFGQHANAAERKAKFDVFWQVLDRLDPRSVIEACEYAERGGLGKICFLEPGDLYKAAEEFSARAARSTKRYLPPAEPDRVDPAMQARISKGLKELVDELARKSLAFGPPVELPHSAASTGPIPISEELRAMLAPTKD